MNINSVIKAMRYTIYHILHYEKRVVPPQLYSSAYISISFRS
jgi:hypothetical protein